MTRILSLDVLRGITVVAMILVNNAGSGSPAFLHHLAWDGCTFADLVFPFFLFIVGASTWLSTRKSNHQLDKKTSLQILKRTALIFFIGVFLNWLSFPLSSNWDTLRIPGVLQRIALVYMLASFLCLWLKSSAKILIASAFILFAYWGILYGTDGLTPKTISTNIIGKVDIAVFGASHMLRAFGHPFDPEGLLSTLPATVNATLGFLIARFIMIRDVKPKALLSMGAIGVGMILVALLWNEVLPFNKRLWSSSYVLYTSGWATLCWAVLSFIVDARGYVKWSGFFRVFGANTLLAYILSIVFAKLNWAFPLTLSEKKITISQWLNKNVFHPILGDTAVYPLLWASTLIFLCWAVTYPLYRRKIFVKL